MNKNDAWDRLLEMGVSEETLRVVTTLNGFSMETLESILFCEFGYRTFDQMEEE